jgi:uncharacterized protein (DUF433 family)/sulfur relay (sulfurtransferase) DsrC/TusE family protein
MKEFIMALRSESRLVSQVGEAIANLGRFERELKHSPGLVEIMSYGRGWYASRVGGTWRFGPSKFVGYAENDAEVYLKTHRDRDGRLTERVLSQWFEEIDSKTALHAELENALRQIFSRHGKSPNRVMRIHVLKKDLGPLETTRRKSPSMGGSAAMERVTVDPEICGGRPCIRGMRIRVSDVLDLLAAGNDRATILSDYPYLESDDIDAALEYAAQAVDHRVIKAA